VAAHRETRLRLRGPGPRGLGSWTWAVREYFVVQDGVSFCLGCGSSVPDEDDPLFGVIAERLELLELG
jgi:hypothetical protein